MTTKKTVITLHFDTDKKGMTLCGRKEDDKNPAFESWGSDPIVSEDPNKVFKFCKKCDELGMAEQDNG